jgi:hypothetical protein
MIAIIATEQDESMHEVVAALANLGRKDVLLLDLEQAFTKVTLSSRFDATGMQWSIQSRANPELVIRPETVTAVYWRRMISHIGSPFLGLPTSANLDPFEIFWSIRWHLESLPARLFPLGHPWAMASAENKHRQLEVALKVGFNVLPTFHSNSPSLLQDFISTQREVAIKALRRPAVTAPGETHRARHIACKSFTSEFLNSRLASVEQGQLYCQRVVQRTHDLRITVLPNEIICAAIDTTSLTGNNLDWREHSMELAHTIVPVEPAFERQLRHFLSEMGLTTGYFDFAVPAEGPPVFFECNTNAQWYWLEKVTGHPYAKAIARTLAAV